MLTLALALALLVPHRMLFDARAGVVFDAGGHRVGTDVVNCAAGRCTGSLQTADGRLDAIWPDGVLSATVTGGTGVYDGARGRIDLQPVSPDEFVIPGTVSTSAAPAAGVVRIHPDPPADRACAAAAKRLAKLPPFPYKHFDPRHPDPKLLKKVGAFFTGRGDPRPIVRRLAADLHDRPIAAGERATVAASTAQDRAALAGDVHAFVASLDKVTAAARRLDVAADLANAPRCAR